MTPGRYWRTSTVAYSGKRRDCVAIDWSGEHFAAVLANSAAKQKALYLSRRVGLFQNGLLAGGRSGNCYRGLHGLASRRGGDRGSALGVSLFQESFRDLLRAAGVVVGLFRFAVFVDRPFALAQHVKNLSEVDVAPDFRPFFRRLGNGLQRFAERIRCRLIVFLVEERLAHAKIRQRAVRLNRKGPLVLHHRIVE